MGRHRKIRVEEMETSKIVKAQEAIKVPPSPSNWGANERRRSCPKCESVRSKINGSRELANPRRIIRNRVCLCCGQRFTTNEPVV